MDNGFNKHYWEKRYQEKQTQWDVGYVSTPLKDYIDQLEDKSIRILIPGCGNAYEGEYLNQKGFKNTYLIDVSEKALQQFIERVPSFPEENLICQDFFHYETLQFDLILEQTFFCALAPSLRSAYARKIHELLKSDGRLVGLLFDGELFKDHPPFGGSKEEYLPFFETLFEINVFDRSYNSIAPRENRELFINLTKNRSN